MKSTAIAVVTFVAFLGSLLLILIANSPQPFGIAQASSEIEVTQTVPVMQAQLEESYDYEREYIGVVEARKSSNLSFEVPGTIDVMAIDEGTPVAQGDTIAQLDTDRLQAVLREARAALEQAEAQLTLARSTLDRIEGARSANAVPTQRLDEALQQRDAAIAARNAALSQVERVQVDIAKSVLTAPFNGVIVRQFADVGESIEAGTPIVTLQTAAPHEIRLGLMREDTLNLTDGSKFTVTLAGQDVEAEVISLIPRRNSARTFELRALMTDASATLFPGDLVYYQTRRTVRSQGMWVPLTALTEAERGLWSLYVAAPPAKSEGSSQHSVERRVCTILYSESEQAYVSGDVQDGELIILDGLHKVVPGQAVRIATGAPQ